MPKNERKNYERCDSCAWSRRYSDKLICIQKKSPFCARLVDKDHWCEFHELWYKVAYMQRVAGWSFEQCIEFVKQYLEEQRKSETKDPGDI